MSYKVGGKIRIKSREYFIEKYGVNSQGQPRLPYGGLRRGKEQVLGTVQVIYDVDNYPQGDVKIIAPDGDPFNFKIEDVEPAVTLIDPRSLK